MAKRLGGLAFLRNAFHDVRHGALLKLLAIASRGAFLLFVVPRLVPGELTEYVFISSVAIVLARILGLGLEEQLPLLIAGKLEAVHDYLPIVNFLVFLQFALSIGIVVSGSSIVAPALLTVCYLTTSFLAGLIRTTRVAGSERLRDLHWLAFGVICLLPVSWTALDLVLIMSLCLMMVHLLEIYLNNQQGIPHELKFSRISHSIEALKESVRQSWRKLLAGAFVLLLARGIILWPRSLGLVEILDDIAFTLLLAEAFWQTAMIIVFRRFAKYCTMGKEFNTIFRDAVASVGAIMGYSAIVAAAILSLSYLNFEISGFSDWVGVSFMIIFFGTLSGYLLLRYVVWVHRDFDWGLASAELIFIFLQGLVVTWLPINYWTAALAIMGLAALGLAVGVVWATTTSLGAQSNQSP